MGFNPSFTSHDQKKKENVNVAGCGSEMQQYSQEKRQELELSIFNVFTENTAALFATILYNVLCVDLSSQAGQQTRGSNS